MIKRKKCPICGSKRYQPADEHSNGFWDCVVKTRGIMISDYSWFFVFYVVFFSSGAIALFIIEPELAFVMLNLWEINENSHYGGKKNDSS